MNKIFDTATGKVRVCNTVLGRGMTTTDIQANGLLLIRDYPIGTGWSMRSPESCQIADHLVYFTLTFHEDRLSKIAFTFIEEGNDAKSLQGQYSQFLRSELGEPSLVEHEGLTVSYRFVWGSVVATYDPHNDTSAIHITWV